MKPSCNIHYSFSRALDANYELSPERKKQVMLFCYYHQNDFPIEMHSHEFYEINIIVEGIGKHYIEDNSFSINAGDFFIIPPNIRHGYSETDNLRIFHIILSDAFFTRYRETLHYINGYSLLFNIEPQLRAKSNMKIFPSLSAGDFMFFRNEMAKLYKLNRSAEHAFETEKCIKTLNLICEFASIVTSHKYDLPIHSFIDIPQIAKVLSFIEHNYAAKITLADLCDIANMSRSALLKQFKTLCNCSPTDYLLSVRIDNAEKMLTKSDYSIATVAQECGFYDSAHFTKAFFTKTRFLPKDYRQAHKNQ